MKKNPQFIIFIPVIIGVGLIIAGIASGIPELVMPAGVAVLFGGSFLTAVIVVIVSLTKAFKEPDKPSTPEEKREHNAQLNSPNRREREWAQAKDAMRSSASTFKNASKGDRIKGCIFVLAFLGCAFTGVILLANELFLPGGILFGTAFLIIIGGAIVSSSAMRRSLSRHYNPADYNKKRGKVKHCSVASTTTVNGRVTKRVFSVTVEADGTEYTGYSLYDYSYGDELEILVHKNGKTVKILDAVISHGDGYDDEEDDTAYNSRARDYDDYDDDDDYEEEDPDEEENEEDPVDEYEGLSGREILDHELKKREDILKSHGLMDEDGKLVGVETESVKVRKKSAEAPTPEPVEPEKPAETEPQPAELEKVVAPAVEPEIKEPTKTETEKPAEPQTEVKPVDTKKPNVGYKGINRKK